MFDCREIAHNTACASIWVQFQSINSLSIHVLCGSSRISVLRPFSAVCFSRTTSFLDIVHPRITRNRMARNLVYNMVLLSRCCSISLPTSSMPSSLVSAPFMPI
jgi:hypothetical protein